MTSIDMWKIPKIVRTPCIEEDIKNLLSDKILQKYKECCDENKKKKIVRITEMLDLCNHLDHFKNYLLKLNKPVLNGDWLDDSIILDNHDYSGCPYDIEALLLYLYSSIIDACAAKSEFKLIDVFFKEEIDDDKLKREGKDYIANLCQKYNEEYGLSKNFKKVFDDISVELKKDFVDNILVLNIKKETEITKDIIKGKYSEWIKKDVDTRIKKIATSIYNVRSQYTHDNIRVFIPSIKYSFTEKIKFYKCVFISTVQTDLFELLKKVIKEHCEKTLVNNV